MKLLIYSERYVYTVLLQQASKIENQLQENGHVRKTGME